MSLGPGWLGGGCHVELGGDGTGHMSQRPGWLGGGGQDRLGGGCASHMGRWNRLS